MILRTTKVMATLAMASALWVVPSLGTQGMGTIRERFSHVDRDLIETDGEISDVATQHALQVADRAVEAAVVR